MRTPSSTAVMASLPLPSDALEPHTRMPSGLVVARSASDQAYRLWLPGTKVSFRIALQTLTVHGGPPGRLWAPGVLIKDGMDGVAPSPTLSFRLAQAATRYIRTVGRPPLPSAHGTVIRLTSLSCDTVQGKPHHMLRDTVDLSARHLVEDPARMGFAAERLAAILRASGLRVIVELDAALGPHLHVEPPNKRGPRCQTPQ